MQPSQTPTIPGSTEGADIFKLPGSLEMPGADALHAELLLRIRDERALVIDGSHVERVSTACLQVLVAACASATGRGHGFTLQSMSDVMAAAVHDLALGRSLGVQTR